MTYTCYRDLGSRDSLIINTSDGTYSIDLNSISIGCAARIDSIPESAVPVNVSDVGRMLVVASTRSIRECEARIKEAVQ